MAKGGKREGAGRPKGTSKKLRLTDGTMAERILAKVDAEQLWLDLIKKAGQSAKTYELAHILKYLEDRVYGKCVVQLRHSGGDTPVEITHDFGSNAAERLTKLLAIATRRSSKVPEPGREGGRGPAD